MLYGNVGTVGNSVLRGSEEPGGDLAGTVSRGLVIFDMGHSRTP